MTNFSFIIPHYNIEPSLLQRCIESIPDREDYEIIIIDDHTPCLYDKENKIIEDRRESLPYIHHDNVRYIFLDVNGGPGVARNLAMKEAQGEWIFFVDGDDYFDKVALGTLMDSCVNSDYDVVWFGFDKRESNHITTETYGFETNMTHIHRCTEEEKWKFITGLGPWNKVARKKFLIDNGINFSEAYFNEDQIFSARLVIESQNAGCFAYPVYNYVQYGNSLSKTYDFDKLILGHKIEKEFNMLLKKHHRLTVETRNSSMGNHLARIYSKSKMHYWYYVVEEFLMFGKQVALADYKQSCIFRSVHPNLFRQLLDPIRVKIGSIIK